MAMAILTLKMLRLTMMIFAGLAVLVAGEEINTTSSASPKVQVSITTTTTPAPPPPTTTTTPAPQLGAVMDIFQAPLAAFKPKMHDKTEMTVGRDQQSSAATPVPSNIFFKAGSGLGSAASSLTGWFNNRMIPQVLRPSSTTTPPPELMFEIVPNQQIKRRIALATENGRKPLRNRQRPVIDDDSEDEDDEEQYNNNEDEEYDPNSNYSYDMKEDNDDDEEDDYQPVEKRKPFKKSQKRPNKQYYYIEEEIFDSDDDDLDSDVEVQMPKRKPPRKQQTQPNRRRKNPPQKKKQQKRRKPVRKVQNAQMVQVMQNRPSYQTQVKRKRRPSSSTFELVPISQNQAINSIQKRKPSSFTENNQQRPSSQFLNIPWSSLGLAGPPKDPASGDQQSKPIIVRIPQQNIKRKKRPTKKQTTNAVKNQRRKPLRGQLQNQSPVFSILSEDEVREIFKIKTQINEEQQMMPQTSHSPMTLENQKKPPKKDSEEMSSNNNEDTEQQVNPQAGSEAASDNDEDTNNSFIAVGQADDEDDKEIDTNLYRHYSNYRGFKRIRAEPRYSHNEEEDIDYDYER